MPRPLVTLTFDLLTLKVVSESRVTWATSANFSLRRPLCSRLRPDVRDRQQCWKQDQYFQTKTKTKTRCTRPRSRPRPKLQDQDQDRCIRTSIRLKLSK